MEDQVRAALVDARNALDAFWAAIGDALLSGKGITKGYAQSVSKEVHDARVRADKALGSIPAPSPPPSAGEGGEHCSQCGEPHGGDECVYVGTSDEFRQHAAHHKETALTISKNSFSVVRETWIARVRALSAALEEARRERDQYHRGFDTQTAALKAREEEMDFLRASLAARLRGEELMEPEEDRQACEICHRPTLPEDMLDGVCQWCHADTSQ